MPNRLAAETSPYLLQHQHNPVDWHAWGPEAFALAAEQQKPVFLSIGYSACHWCHVMEHESFENEGIAKLLNENFVSIKVDREERPDVDQIYMQAVQILTGRGGWPMSMFLTPEGQPFFGGTYWPPTARGGMPGFDQVLQGIAEVWRDRRDQAVTQAEKLTEHLRHASVVRGAGGSLDVALLEAAGLGLHQIHDPLHGGFGDAPKFPHAMDLRLLARIWRRDRTGPTLEMLTLSLEKMAAGGIYDHLAGGFHRYAVDDHWLVPHFEKMLYDNAMLAAAYLDGYRTTGREDFAQVVRETLDYVLREMTSPEGGFYSTQDADSEGVEGKFYVWTPAEIAAVLGPERAAVFCQVYDVTETGNFEGANILHLAVPLATRATLLGRELPDLERELAESRRQLLAARKKRIAPGLDDKILVAWNSLAIEALADAAGALDEPRYLEAARRAADFLLAKLRTPDGRLLHSYRQGQARFEAYLDDYAGLANALITLYENTFDERYLEAAIGLTDELLARFVDAEDGGFYYTADDHEPLVTRARDVQDGATPSGNGLAATALVRLARITGDHRYAEAGERVLTAFGEFLRRFPHAAGQMLMAVDILLEPARQAVLLGDPNSPELRAVLHDLRRRMTPPVAVLVRDPAAKGQPRAAALDAMFAGKTNQGAGPTLYLCENFACQEPAQGQQAIGVALAPLFAQSG